MTPEYQNAFKRSVPDVLWKHEGYVNKEIFIPKLFRLENIVFHMYQLAKSKYWTYHNFLLNYQIVNKEALHAWKQVHKEKYYVTETLKSHIHDIIKKLKIG